MTGILTAGLFRHLGNTTVNYPVIYTVKRALNSELIVNLSEIKLCCNFLDWVYERKRTKNAQRLQ